MIFKADDLVGLAAQLGNSIRRRHWDCENDFGMAYAGSAQGCAGRCPGGDPIVDHDGGTAADICALAAAQIPLTPPLDFGQLAVADALNSDSSISASLITSSFRTMIGAPPSTTAPMASSGWKGTPTLRTRIRSSGASSTAATSAATVTPPRGSARTTGCCSL